MITNYEGSISTSFADDPFGSDYSNLGPGPDPSEQHFTGKDLDPESSLTFFTARYYNGYMGRFMSPDWSATIEPVPYAKLGKPQSLNLYSYALNNPLSRRDPDGHYVDSNAMAGAPVAFAQGFAQFSQDLMQALASDFVNALNMTQSDNAAVPASAQAPMAQPANITQAVVMAVAPLLVGPVVTVEVDAAAPAALETESSTVTDMVTPEAGSGTYEQQVAAAQEAYPNKAGTIENHHIAPKYLGGPGNGPKVPLDGAYHQVITNEFRNLVPYGGGPVPPEQLQDIMDSVYSTYPLPPGSN